MASCFASTVGLPLSKRCTDIVTERTETDLDKIYDPADTEQTCCAEPEDSCADLADIESVDAEFSKEDAEKKCDKSALVGCCSNVLSHFSHLPYPSRIIE